MKVSGNQVTFTIPALTTIALKADRSPNLTDLKITGLKLEKDPGTGYFQLSAGIDSLDLVEVKFYSRVKGSNSWQLIGTDHNAPFSQFVPAGNAELFEYKAVAFTSSGQAVERTN